MNNTEISLRLAQIEDLSILQELFVNTIKSVCANDYNPAQIKVWTSSVKNNERWINRLKVQYFLVALIKGEIAGYASLENNEYVDHFYVHKDYQRKGVANNLYNALELHAKENKSVILTSDVSITALPFFEKKGFQVVKKQNNQINGVEIVNYKMIKPLQ